MDLTTADPLIGQLFDGRYRVDARVARGGMATVYTGFDTRLDRIVAIKVMHQALAEDDAFVARFHREAKAAARLSHPNVVAIYDQGSDAGRVFLVMEHVDGGTLRERLRREGRLTPAAALGVMEPVLQALAAAHDAGLVHRDVKPENILISTDGRVKVADFGLARAIETTGMTTAGLLIGTVSYLAPEQVVTGRADARSDVYSAGIVLFELLTGAPPYDGDTPLSVAYRHVNDSVPAPSSLLIGISPELDEVVLRATHRDPDARPATARDLLVGVRRAQQVVADAGATTVLRPVMDAPTLVTQLPSAQGHNVNHTRVLRAPGGGRPPVVAPVRRRRRRPRRGAVVGMLIALLLLAAMIVGWQFGRPDKGTRKAANTNPSSAASSRQQPAATPSQALIITEDVSRLTPDKAKAALERQGFTVNRRDDFDDKAAAGTLLYQAPKPGVVVTPGPAAQAQIVVSKGPQLVGVPKLAGLTRAKALDALTALRLTGKTTQQYDEKVAKDLVVSVDPPAGRQIRLGAPVTLVISQGKKPIPVPVITGKTYAAGAKVLTAAGLKPAPREEFSAKVAAGSVISQSPSTGTLFGGDSVKVVVSKGPPPVAMPALFGLKRSEAIRKVERLGLKVALVEFPGRHGRTVIDQRPNAGVLVPAGSTVSIYLV